MRNPDEPSRLVRWAESLIRNTGLGLDRGRRSPRSGKKILFIHVGKTGGSSFNRILERNFDGEIHCERYIETTEGRDGVCQRRLGNVEFLSGLDFISGHISYDALRNSRLDLCEYVLVTILRHPFAQTISHLNWVIKISANSESELFKKSRPNVQKMSLDLRMVEEWSSEAVVQWLDRYRGWFQNSQSRYFVRQDQLSSESVIEIMGHMHLAGVTERIDKFVSRFRTLANLPYRFNIYDVPHENHNKAYHVPLSVLKDTDLQAFLSEYNWSDMAVYDYVDRFMAP